MLHAFRVLARKKALTTTTFTQNHLHRIDKHPDQPNGGNRLDLQLLIEATPMKLLLAVCLLLSLATPSLAQMYQPFQIARPVGVGTAGTGLNAGNRIYRAYPGIPYQIHADAVGGRWPYTYSLSGAPDGMTIEAGPCTNIGPRGCTAGTITWSNPTTGTTNPITVTIRDADSRVVTGTWSITVNSTIGANGFCFIDGDNSAGGRNGSLANPYNSLLEALPGCGPGSFLYFRESATPYTIASALEDGSNPGDCGRRVNVFDGSTGVIWVAYPGESPVIDFQSTGNIRPCFNVQGSNIWIDGLGIRNIGSIGFRLNSRNGGYGAVVRNINAQGLMAGLDGSNSSFFLWSRCDGCPTWFDTAQNSYFANVASVGCSLKVYGVQYGIFETSAYSRTVDNEATLALKGEVPRYTVRANTFASDVRTGIGGNMATSSSNLTYGEVYHNLSLASGTNDVEGGLTLGAARVTPIGPTWVYRNTFIGHVLVTNITSTDGPFYLLNNVIVNSGGTGGGCPTRLTCYYTTAYDRIQMTTNLQGTSSDGILDTTGLLQGSYRSSWIGLRGFELSANPGSGGADLTPPLAPQNVRIF